jgi:hypothetical protein
MSVEEELLLAAIDDLETARTSTSRDARPPSPYRRGRSPASPADRACR